MEKGESYHFTQELKPMWCAASCPGRSAEFTGSADGMPPHWGDPVPSGSH